MLRKRGGNVGRILVGIVVNAAPHQRPRIGPQHIDDQRCLGEVRPVRIGLTTTSAAALLHRAALTINPEIDAPDAALDDEGRLVRRSGQTSPGERHIC